MEGVPGSVGFVSIAFGTILVLSRGAMLVAPGATSGWFRHVIGTTRRTRIFGACVVLVLAAPMVWAGASEDTGIATLLFVLGIFIVAVTIPMLVVFPRAYMDLAAMFLPAEDDSDFVGWRLLGLVGVVIGGAFILAGLDAV